MSARPAGAPPGRGAGGAPVAVRPMTASDLPSVLSLERTVYPSPWRVEHFAQLLDLPAGMGFVATVPPGEVVGYALGWVAAGEAELANIAVVAERRRGGVGGRLIEAVLAEARDRGAGRLYLEVRISNQGAQTFYRRYGFAVVGRRPRYYARPAEDAYVMAVDLSPRPT